MYSTKVFDISSIGQILRNGLARDSIPDYAHRYIYILIQIYIYILTQIYIFSYLKNFFFLSCGFSTQIVLYFQSMNPIIISNHLRNESFTIFNEILFPDLWATPLNDIDSKLGVRGEQTEKRSRPKVI